MAGARSGAVVALLLYTLLLKFIQPTNINPFKQSLNNKYANIIHNNDKLISHWIYRYKQTNKIHGVFGYGEYTLAILFKTPNRYNRRVKRIKTTCKQQTSQAVIIAICLLLSGDIHQCPGPTTNGASISDVSTRNSTSAQVCSTVRFIRQTYFPRCALSLSTMEDPEDILRRPTNSLTHPGETGSAGRLRLTAGKARGEPPLPQEASSGVVDVERSATLFQYSNSGHLNTLEDMTAVRFPMEDRPPFNSPAVKPSPPGRLAVMSTSPALPRSNTGGDYTLVSTFDVQLSDKHRRNSSDNHVYKRNRCGEVNRAIRKTGSGKSFKL